MLTCMKCYGNWQSYLCSIVPSRANLTSIVVLYCGNKKARQLNLRMFQTEIFILQLHYNGNRDNANGATQKSWHMYCLWQANARPVGLCALHPVGQSSNPLGGGFIGRRKRSLFAH